MATSTFLWSSTPATVYRKVPGGEATLALRVERPSFGSYTNPHRWELKLVRDYFGCGVLADNTKFQCGAGAAPSIVWELSSPSPNYENASAPSLIGTSTA